MLETEAILMMLENAEPASNGDRRATLRMHGRSEWVRSSCLFIFFACFYLVCLLVCVSMTREGGWTCVYAARMYDLPIFDSLASVDAKYTYHSAS